MSRVTNTFHTRDNSVILVLTCRSSYSAAGPLALFKLRSQLFFQFEMALRIAFSSPSIRSPPPSSSSFYPSPSSVNRSLNWPPQRSLVASGRGGRTVSARSSLETAVGQVTEVDKDTFWPLLKACGDRVVVLDMYTQWCGPCKLIAPKFKQLSETYLDVTFMKLDCNQQNKSLAKELGIRVVPTFKIFKDGKVANEVTGAKFDDLVLAIDAVRSN
ncbi:hypothetical protein Cni_G24353 [Canna indica]|uniref:Thioredoxin domain-containing protein n=1 Tax=Canna indica TaxID=4628 RepID=A0AAQ3L298_9LILI|nr:hypothetical protein Cni_G24353 [Canna indica]